jgi:hypothetical protein
MSMTSGERPIPLRGRGSERSQSACEVFGPELSRYLAGDRLLAERQHLRAHLEDCSDCNELYRSSLLIAARAGRELRLGREEQAGQASFEARAAALARSPVATDSKGSRSRRIALQALILGGLGLALFLQGLPNARSGPAATFEVLSGTATRDGELARPDAPPTALTPGAHCSTGERASALLRVSSASLRLSEHSEVLLEGCNPARMRLVRGEVLVDGPALLTSVLGVVEVRSGRTRLAIRGGVLSVACESGASQVSTVDGVRDLAAGESLELADPPAPARD